MCMFNTPSPDPVQMPPEYAQMKTPDADTVADAGKRERDRLRSGTQTILTSGSGVTAAAPTEKKTLLGQ